jgi:hypothetical protein
LGCGGRHSNRRNCGAVRNLRAETEELIAIFVTIVRKVKESRKK